MKRFSIATLFLAIVSGLIFQSCGKTELAELSLNFTQTVNGEAIASGSSYTIGGNKVDINTANMYVSNFRLVNDGGQEVSLPGYMLVTPTNKSFDIGSFLENGYTKIRFDVGVDSAVNHADPSQYPAGNILGAQTPNMHWSWMMGYIFLRIDGAVDTDGDDSAETFFEVHLGTDNYLKTIEIDYDLNAKGDESYEIDINFDLAKLYDGVDITTDNTTHVGDNPTLAASIVENLGSAFSAQ